MKLGVNARRLAGQRLGIGRYIEYMVKHWSPMLDPADQITLYTQEPVDTRGLPVSGPVGVRPLSPKLTGLLWENLILARCSGELDVLFCPAYTAPISYRGRYVVATHSLNEAQPGTHEWWYALVYTPWYRLSAQRADIVIVPSQAVMTDMEQHYGIAPQRIEVIPLGVSEIFRPIDDEGLRRSTRQRYLGADIPYIVFVDKLSQRRNIPLLLEAFAVLKKREGIPHSLLLFGPNYLNLPIAQMVTQLGITDSVVQTDGRVASHEELPLVYNAADLFVLPSSYEGFSLPVLEAMACGVPVVTTNRAALAEIATGHALLIEDLTVDALSDAIARALTDQGLRDHLRAKGLERARSYRWEDTARSTLDTLRRVAQQ